MAWRQFCGVSEEFYDSHKTAIKRLRDLLDMAEEHLDAYGNTDAQFAEYMLRKYQSLIVEMYTLAEGVLDYLHKNTKWIVYGDDFQDDHGR
jgi:hypothetical protein